MKRRSEDEISSCLNITVFFYDMIYVERWFEIGIMLRPEIMTETDFVDDNIWGFTDRP